MSDKFFTPGPWAVEADDEHAGKHVFHDCRYITAGSKEDDSWEIIARMSDAYNQAANAYLVAKAPDLLAMLQMMVTWAQNTVVPNLGEEALPRGFEKALAVLTDVVTAPEPIADFGGEWAIGANGAPPYWRVTYDPASQLLQAVRKSPGIEERIPLGTYTWTQVQKYMNGHDKPDCLFRNNLGSLIQHLFKTVNDDALERARQHFVG